ncbi:uncharacterized protein J3R85_012402 [Psidium guajava]|nr:uncharacterized protein J3R85_012402 [Psidium guajava]
MIEADDLGREESRARRGKWGISTHWTSTAFCATAAAASSLSAVKAAKVRWPGLFDGVDSATEDWIVDQMHIVNQLSD